MSLQRSEKRMKRQSGSRCWKTSENLLYSIGNQMVLLARAAEIALRVFSMSASTTASERNFSTFGFIHSKQRNCLSNESVEKLVFIKTNYHALSRGNDSGGVTAWDQWYDSSDDETANESSGSR